MNALHLSKGQTLADVSADVQPSDEKALSNMFAILEIEESADQEETVATPAKDPTPSRPATTRLP
jgi:hypothetical protein